VAAAATTTIDLHPPAPTCCATAPWVDVRLGLPAAALREAGEATGVEEGEGHH